MANPAVRRTVVDLFRIAMLPAYVPQLSKAALIFTPPRPTTAANPPAMYCSILATDGRGRTDDADDDDLSQWTARSTGFTSPTNNFPRTTREGGREGGRAIRLAAVLTLAIIAIIGVGVRLSYIPRLARKNSAIA